MAPPDPGGGHVASGQHLRWPSNGSEYSDPGAASVGIHPSRVSGVGDRADPLASVARISSGAESFGAASSAQSRSLNGIQPDSLNGATAPREGTGGSNLAIGGGRATEPGLPARPYTAAAPEPSDSASSPMDLDVQPAAASAAASERFPVAPQPGGDGALAAPLPPVTATGSAPADPHTPSDIPTLPGCVASAGCGPLHSLADQSADVRACASGQPSGSQLSYSKATKGVRPGEVRYIRVTDATSSYATSPFMGPPPADQGFRALPRHLLRRDVAWLPKVAPRHEQIALDTTGFTTAQRSLVSEHIAEAWPVHFGYTYTNPANKVRFDVLVFGQDPMVTPAFTSSLLSTPLRVPTPQGILTVPLIRFGPPPRPTHAPFLVWLHHWFGPVSFDPKSSDLAIAEFSRDFATFFPSKLQDVAPGCLVTGLAHFKRAQLGVAPTATVHLLVPVEHLAALKDYLLTPHWDIYRRFNRDFAFYPALPNTAFRHGPTQGPPKPSTPTVKDICYKCRETGHWRHQCHRCPNCSARFDSPGKLRDHIADCRSSPAAGKSALLKGKERSSDPVVPAPGVLGASAQDVSGARPSGAPFSLLGLVEGVPVEVPAAGPQHSDPLDSSSSQQQQVAVETGPADNEAVVGSSPAGDPHPELSDPPASQLSAAGHGSDDPDSVAPPPASSFATNASAAGQDSIAPPPGAASAPDPADSELWHTNRKKVKLKRRVSAASALSNKSVIAPLPSAPEHSPGIPSPRKAVRVAGPSGVLDDSAMFDPPADDNPAAGNIVRTMDPWSDSSSDDHELPPLKPIPMDVEMEMVENVAPSLKPIPLDDDLEMDESEALAALVAAHGAAAAGRV